MNNKIKDKKNFDSYRKLAPYYDQLIGRHYYDNLYSLFKKYTKNLPKNSSHLDVGCGTGLLIKESKKLKFLPEGIDISAQMIIVAKKNNPGVNIYEFDIMDVMKTYKIITACNDVLNHLKTDHGLKKILKHIYNILLPGGIFFSDAVSAYDILFNWENCTHTYSDNSTFKCYVTHKIIDKNKPAGLMERSWEFNNNCKWEKDCVETEIVQGITPDEIMKYCREIGFDYKLFEWHTGNSYQANTSRLGLALWKAS